MASVAKHIRRLRTERHMTQGDLAEKLFVTRQTVSAWETGKAQPDLETLERIAVVLGVEVTELIYGAPQSPNLRELKQKWAIIGGALVSAIAALLFSWAILIIWAPGVVDFPINITIWTTYFPFQNFLEHTA